MCQITGQPGSRRLLVCDIYAPNLNAPIPVPDDFTLNYDGHVGALALRPKIATPAATHTAFLQLHLFVWQRHIDYRHIDYKRPAP